jgi:predicted ATPase with chaperone activity
MVMAAMGCDYQEGKPMLARRLTTILPSLPLAEAIETTRIYPPITVANLGRAPAMTPSPLQA